MNVFACPSGYMRLSLSTSIGKNCLAVSETSLNMPVGKQCLEEKPAIVSSSTLSSCARENWVSFEQHCSDMSVSACDASPAACLADTCKLVFLQKRPRVKELLRVMVISWPLLASTWRSSYNVCNVYTSRRCRKNTEGAPNMRNRGCSSRAANVERCCLCYCLRCGRVP